MTQGWGGRAAALPPGPRLGHDRCQKEAGAQPRLTPSQRMAPQTPPTFVLTCKSHLPGAYLIGELDMGRRTAELPADVHLDAPREGRLCSLDGAHDPAWVAGRWAHCVCASPGHPCIPAPCPSSPSPSPPAPQGRAWPSSEGPGCPLTGWTRSSVLAQRHSSGQPR